jgi:hypothetical protein
MKRLPILIAVAVVAAGIGAAAYYGVVVSDGGSAQAPTQRDIVNGKLKANGLPTLPSEDKQTARAATALVEPTWTPIATAVSSHCGPPGFEITDTPQYGSVADCHVYGTDWVAATSGDPANGVSGVLLILSCPQSDADCLIGSQTPVPMSAAVPTGWAAYPPPSVGSLKILRWVPPSTLVVVDSGAIYCFNVSTRQFRDGPACL